MPSKKLKACELDYANLTNSFWGQLLLHLDGDEILNSTAHSEALSEIEKNGITDGLDDLVVFGGIKYSGVGQEDYETRYCWNYHFSGIPVGPLPSANEITLSRQSKHSIEGAHVWHMCQPI
jgi:hypothetical protein